MRSIAWGVLALSLIWSIVMAGLLGLYAYTYYADCQTPDCAHDLLGAAILLGLWGWAGYAFISAGLASGAFLLVSWWRRRSRTS